MQSLNNNVAFKQFCNEQSYLAKMTLNLNPSKIVKIR